jgi:hypothetical protein
MDAGEKPVEICCRIVRLGGLSAITRLSIWQAGSCRRLTGNRHQTTIVDANDQLRVQEEGLLVLDHTDEKEAVDLTYAPDRKGTDTPLTQPELGKPIGLCFGIDRQGDFFRTGNPNHANLTRSGVSWLGRNTWRQKHQTSVRFTPMRPSALCGSGLQCIEIGGIDPLLSLRGQGISCFGRRFRRGRKKEQPTLQIAFHAPAVSLQRCFERIGLARLHHRSRWGLIPDRHQGQAQQRHKTAGAGSAQRESISHRFSSLVGP